MIVYKWCIKIQDKYYPLVNFKIHPGIETTQPPYEINKNYDHYIDLLKEKYEKCPYLYRSVLNQAGFHFFKNPKPKLTWKQYNHCLERSKQPRINSILKCEIKRKDIIGEDIRLEAKELVARKFKVLKEVNINETSNTNRRRNYSKRRY